MRTDPTPSEPPTSGDPDVDRARRVAAAHPKQRVSRPFIVQVAALRSAAGMTRDEVRRGAIADLGAVSVSVLSDAEVEADLTLSSYPGGIMAVGMVTAPWHGECRRCGGPVAGVVTARVRERYASSGQSDEDEDAYLLEGDELDLEPLARDAVLLELPLAPLCADDCYGLCPQCGANRNVSTCQCVAVVDPRWAALDTLRDA